MDWIISMLGGLTPEQYLFVVVMGIATVSALVRLPSNTRDSPWS